MNLYDIMGPVSIAAGVGAAYGRMPAHSIGSWASLVIAAALGAGIFLVLRRMTAKASDRALPALYIGTPVAVIVAVVSAAWAVHASLP